MDAISIVYTSQFCSPFIISISLNYSVLYDALNVSSHLAAICGINFVIMDGSVYKNWRITHYLIWSMSCSMLDGKHCLRKWMTCSFFMLMFLLYLKKKLDRKKKFENSFYITKSERVRTPAVQNKTKNKYNLKFERLTDIT